MTNREDSLQLPITAIGRYTILDVMGEGGMGKVYRATDSVLKRDVAIKVLTFDDFQDEGFRRFQQEAQATSKLDHPGIVKVFDFGVTENRQPYLVMELVDGKTLSDILAERKRLDIDFFQSLFGQLANAVDHAHSKGIIHRDIKPSNIIITEEGQPIILDFGISKSLLDEKSLVNTETGLVIGSPRYISPEQIHGGKIDARSDIYSLGCVMFEALTGHPPFRGKTAIETIQMHLNDEPPLLSDQVENSIFAEELEMFIAKALAKEESDRFQTMHELSESLDSILTKSQDSEEFHSSYPPSKNSSAKKMVLPAVILVVVFVPLLAFISFSGKNQTQVDSSPRDPVKGLDFGELSRIDDKPIFEEKNDNRNGFRIIGHGPRDEDLKELARYKRPFSLQLMDEDITGKGFQYLTGSPIIEVQLGDSALTDAGLVNLGKIETLKVVDVKGTSVTDSGVAYLQNLPRLVHLDLSRTKISGKGLKAVSRCSSLTWLNLEGCSGISSGLHYLRNLPKLDTLVLNQTDVKPEDLKELAAKKDLLVGLHGCPGFKHLTGNSSTSALTRLSSLKLQ